MGNYRIQSEIGSGAFGKVYLGYHSLIRCKVCLKKGNRVITDLKTTSSTRSSFNNDNLMREFYYLREFRHHPHITKLYEIIFTETSVYMILEYYPSGDLFEYVTKNRNLKVSESLRIFTQLLGAVNYLHKSGCCHRDLKLENILLDKHMNVKLSDFGFTRELPLAQHGARSMLSEYCGTGAYMAPEIVKRIPYSGIKIDIWALGVILYTMLTGEMPFDDSLETKELEYAIIHNKPRFLEDIEYLDKNSIDTLQHIKILLNQMLSKDPEDRCGSLEDVLKLPLFENYNGVQQVEIVNKLLFDTSNSKNSWSDLTSSEKALFKDLVATGVDREILKRAIQEETLDSVYGFWTLLNDQNTRKQKKSKSLKRRSMLKLSRSRSLLGGARQAFSPSPVMGEDPIGGGSNTSLLFMSRSGSMKRSNISSGVDAVDSEALNRSASLTKVKNLITGADRSESNKKLNAISESKDTKNKNSNDQVSIISKSTQITSASKLSLKSKSKGKKGHFSLFGFFKSSPSFDNKKATRKKSSEEIRFLGRTATNTSTTTKSTNSKSILHKETSNLVAGFQKTPVKFNLSNESDDNIPVTPDQLRLKRSEPTRPGSEVSNYSAQTSISETSNGSGYITGYSTDVNVLGSTNANIATPNISINNNSVVTNANEIGGIKPSNSYGASNNLNQHFLDQAQIVLSPQNSNKPRFSRGISDWSTNVSSQAESPNSSFVALSRTNSIDSTSRSISSRNKGKSKNFNSNVNANMTFVRRGRSPLNSKMTTKWAFHNVGAMKCKTPISKEQRQSKIIEETSEQEEEDDGEETDEADHFVRGHSDGFNKLKNGNDTVSRSSRMYMRKGSIKFPTLPITEENDADSDLEDEADVEEDNHDFDDVVTEFSQDSTRHRTLYGSASSIGGTALSGNNTGDIVTGNIGYLRPLSVDSGSSLNFGLVDKLNSVSATAGRNHDTNNPLDNADTKPWFDKYNSGKATPSTNSLFTNGRVYSPVPTSRRSHTEAVKNLEESVIKQQSA